MISRKVGQSYLGTSWYIVTTSQIGPVFLRTSEALQKRLKWVFLVPDETLWWCLNMVQDVKIGH